MDSIEILTPDQTEPRDLSPAEAAMTDNVMRHCLAVEPAERVVVVADHASRSLGELFYAGALRRARAVRLLIMPVTEGHGAEPPAAVALAMRAADVCLLPVSKSLSHTHARQAASAAGARIASMPAITHELALRTLTVDYTQIAHTARRLAAAIGAADTIQLTSPGGCDLSFSVRGRAGLADTGLFTEPGDFGNLPAGEAFVAPVEGTANGALVIDAASIVPEIPLGPPTVIEVRDGLAVAVEGTAAAELQRVFDRLGDDARNIAEFGIGTNPATRLSGNVLESEKVVGTAHVALGNSRHIGGTVDVPFHNDGVIAQPTVRVGERALLTAGVLV